MGKRKRRPVTYKDWITEEGLVKLEGWARDGLTNEQIADNIGIAEGTIYAWMKKYSEIDKALKKGKEVVDRHVENALLNNALGHKYEEEQAFKTKKVYYDENGKRCEEEVIEKIKVEKWKDPDTTAQIFWLKNRKPNEWRDKRNVNVDGKLENIGVTIVDDIKE